MRVTWEEMQADPLKVLEAAAAGAHVVVTRDGTSVLDVSPRNARRVPWVVGVTGASGIRYAASVIRGLVEAGEPIDLIVTRAARLTILDETGVAFRDSHWQEDLAAWLDACGITIDQSAADVRHWSPGDFSAGPSSGSYLTKGMVVVPATSAAVAGIAVGSSKDLVQRAAEVTLKERRRLVVVPRETPFTRALLRHLLALDEMGAIVLPANPGYYAGTADVAALVDFVAGKVLDVIGVEHSSFARWHGELGGGRPAPDEGRAEGPAPVETSGPPPADL